SVALSTVVLMFLFHYHLHPRYLHSFPTRRSSDLQAIAKRVKQGELSIDDIDENIIADNLFTAGINDPDLLIRTSGEVRLSNFLLDRKSTRLNSSHVSISYAVFCLKKKTYH